MSANCWLRERRLNSVYSSFWQRFRRAILDKLDQFFAIFSLPTFTSTLESRLRKLRRLYYHNPTFSIEHGPARDIVHNHVEKRFRHYYEKFLSVERLIFTSATFLTPTRQTELLQNTQKLSNHIATWLESVQNFEKQIKSLRDPSLPLVQHLTLQRDHLLQQIDKALSTQSAIVGHLTSLSQRRFDRNLSRDHADLHTFNQFLHDVEASYAEIIAADNVTYDDDDDTLTSTHATGAEKSD